MPSADTEQLLDLLGNENRRRILRLLSRRPCYVTEISNTIRVAPKAVIEHLELLETGGLIESYVDTQRRKYFQIAEDILAEFRLAPFDFDFVLEEVEERMEVPDLWEFLPPEFRPEPLAETRDLADLARSLEEMRRLQKEVRDLQRYVHFRVRELNDRLRGEAERLAGDPLGASLLAALARGARTAADLQRELGAPPAEAEAALRGLQDRKLIRRQGETWVLEEE